MFRWQIVSVILDLCLKRHDNAELACMHGTWPHLRIPRFPPSSLLYTSVIRGWHFFPRVVENEIRCVWFTRIGLLSRENR